MAAILVQSLTSGTALLQADIADGQECVVNVVGTSHIGKGKLQLRTSSSDEPKQPLVTRISRHA